MNFFKQLTEVGVQKLELKVIIKDDVLSVIIIPEVKNENLIPLTVSGTAEELDEDFFNVITTPLQKVAGLSSNISDFEKSAEAKPATTGRGKKAKDEDVDNDDDNEEGSEDETKTTAKKAPAKTKAVKPVVYKHQKYLDAILNIVNAEGYVLTEENKTELSDAVDKLLVMDSKNEIALEWEKKIKDLSPKEETKVEEKPEPVKEDSPTPEIVEEKPVEEKKVPEVKVEEKKATPPPAPPVEENLDEDDNDDDFDLDFDDFFEE